MNSERMSFFLSLIIKENFHMLVSDDSLACVFKMKSLVMCLGSLERRGGGRGAAMCGDCRCVREGTLVLPLRAQVCDVDRLKCHLCSLSVLHKCFFQSIIHPRSIRVNHFEIF